MTTTQSITYRDLTDRQFDALHFLALVHAGRTAEAMQAKGFRFPRRDVFDRLHALGLAAQPQLIGMGYKITPAGLAVIEGRSA